jgi:hypothetical protein
MCASMSSSAQFKNYKMCVPKRSGLGASIMRMHQHVQQRHACRAEITSLWLADVVVVMAYQTIERVVDVLTTVNAAREDRESGGAGAQGAVRERTVECGEIRIVL